MTDTPLPEMLVCVNDLQLLRNCDDEAVGAFLKFLEFYKDRITHIVLNGDILDMEQANRFGSSPDMAGTMRDELVAGKWFLGTLTDLLPNAEKVFVLGNHEIRWNNYLINRFDGAENWIKTLDEVFEFRRLGWKVVPYGMGNSYKWHNRLFWHGKRAGSRSNIPKLEFDDTLVATTTAHINKNMFWETRSAFGEVYRNLAHGGFSKDNLTFMKTPNTRWAQGFGVYYWSKETGEQPYMVVMDHGTPSFIWEGRVFNGAGFDIRSEIGLDPIREKVVQIKQYGNVVVFNNQR